jgi:hypothetical protein
MLGVQASEEYNTRAGMTPFFGFQATPLRMTEYEELV